MFKIMFEEIMFNFFRINVPLPGSPLKNLNAYLIKGEDRNLLIDTGFNKKESWEALNFNLKELEVSIEKTDFFFTHMHSDHAGLACAFKTDSSLAYMSKTDALVLNTHSKQEYWHERAQFFSAFGFPAEDFMQTRREKMSNLFFPVRDVAYKLLSDGDQIQVGQYYFTCVETPGHTPGHMCLYEKNLKLLVAGDHILDEISPNLTAWQEMSDSVGEYIKNLEKINELEIELVLPGHRRLIYDCKSRIAELLEHHEERINEVLNIMQGNGLMDAYEVASLMTWRLKNFAWENFPVYQKMFAFGEALAHLEYLYLNKIIQRIEKNGKFYYTRVYNVSDDQSSLSKSGVAKSLIGPKNFYI